MKIYLLMGCIDYDGCTPIAAFKTLEKAEEIKTSSLESASK